MSNGQMVGSTRYGGVAIFLHWVSALFIVSLIVLGLVMTDLPRGSSLQFSLFQWHKTIGVISLGLVLIRLGWRITHPAPTLPETMVAWEKKAAHAGHLGLYALIVFLPLTGWALVSVSPFNIPTMLFGVIHWPHLPFLAGLTDKKPVFEVFETAHAAAAWVLIALLVVHAGAALRHHFMLKDDVLRRMLPGLPTPSRRLPK